MTGQPATRLLTEEPFAPPATGDPGVTVLVHGMEDHHSSWKPLLDNWPGSTGADVVCLDMPWRRGNDYSWRGRGTSGWWLGQALAELGRPIRSLIGHSFGANAVMTHLAGLHPSQPLWAYPRSAVLLAPFYRPSTTPVDDSMRARSRAGFADIIAEGLRLKLGARYSRLEPDVLQAMSDGVFRRLLPAGFETFFDSFTGSGDLALAGAGARVPTLVIAGAADEGLGMVRAAALSVAMPNALLHMHDDYGHFCHVEKADAVAREIDHFLSAVAPAAAFGHERTAR